MLNYITRSFIDNLRSLWTHVHTRRRWQFYFVTGLMLFTSFIEVLGIGSIAPFLLALTSPELLFEHKLMQPLVHLINATKPKDLLLPVAVTFAAFALLACGFRLILLWAMMRVASATGADLSVSAYRRTLYQPYSVHIGRNSGTVINGVHGQISDVVGLVILPSLMLINSTVMILLVISSLIFIDVTMAISALLGFVLVYAFIIQLSKGKLKENGSLINRENIQIHKALQEALGGIRDVIIDGTQEVYCRAYERSVRQMRRANANLQIIGGSPRYAVESLGMIVIATIAFFLASRPEGIHTALPLMGVLVLSAQRLLPLLQQAYGSWTQIRSSRETFADVLNLLSQPLPSLTEGPHDEHMPFQDGITMKQLSYRYENGGKLVLRQIELSVPKGVRLGVIGKTGSGKSTFLDVLMGLLVPTEGSLLIDDRVVTEKNSQAWQKHVAHVPQAIFLADLSIGENIAFGVPRELIDYERVRDAASKAQIADIIDTWPEGYETRTGERGIRLSGGQRQRIGIARALYKKADVLIFDEATSALDSQTESAVMSVINELSPNLTIVMVAHRMSTLANCTKIIEIENGEIVRTGDYCAMKD